MIDLRISRNDPKGLEDSHKGDKWESRPGGIWILRSSKHKDAESSKAITGIDVLYGPDAVEPRHGWTIRQTALLIDSRDDGRDPRLTMRRGKEPSHRKDTPAPRIRKNGKFKILQVSDLHLSTGLGACRDAMDKNGEVRGKCEADPRTLEFIQKIRDDEAPDMVVLSGDQVNGDTAPDVQTAIFKIVDLFASKNIPYAAIFGNHDDEGPENTRMSRSAQMSLMQLLPDNLARPGPEDINGVGNYFVQVGANGMSKHSAMTIYFLDSHAYSPDEKRYHGYDWIKQSQIDWFKDTAAKLKPSNDKYAFKHMNLAFIHIALPEFTMEGNIYVGGEFREPSTAPHFNSGFYTALKEAGVVAVGCGHDHVNDMCSLVPQPNKNSKRDDPQHSYDTERQKPGSHDEKVSEAAIKELANSSENKKHDNGLGPWMCYAGGSGFGGYGGYGGFHRRVRVWEVDTNAGRITTWTRLECCGKDTHERHNELVIVEGGSVIPPSQA